MKILTPAEIFLDDIRLALDCGGIDESRQEARIIAEHILNCEYSSILAGLAPAPSPQNRDLADSIIRDRLSGKPLVHIIGYSFFYDNKFHVSPGVLVPRPETELIVNTALKYIDSFGWPRLRLLDLYTGCGNIILSIAFNRDVHFGIGIDINARAIACAVQNRDELERISISFINCPVEDYLQGNIDDADCFQIITANPPYVPSADIDNLQPEVSRYEDRRALDGGRDGLKQFRFLASHAIDYLKHDGVFIAEIGIRQSDELINIFKSWGKIEFLHDLSGIPRVMIVRK